MIRKISFSEAHTLLQENPSITLLDVREEPEYLSGHARDALLLPVDEINAESAEAMIPAKDKPIMVYCRTGRRSARAAKLLSDLGYEDIRDIGGLVGWPYGLE
ncbi:MAG: rhodanese-like domain-containing protein [Oscillospiraceae bacterium]|nr:rhodanese-like domain-containing protein [Oscillospiraceae bacterium]